LLQLQRLVGIVHELLMRRLCLAWLFRMWHVRAPSLCRHARASALGWDCSLDPGPGAWERRRRHRRATALLHR
jgi:hypothetical protein